MVVALAAGAVSSKPREPNHAAPAIAADSFFRFHLRDGCNYGRRDIAKRRHLLSAKLNASFQRYFRAEARFHETRPQDIYFYNGDPFTGSQEYPVWYSLGRTRVSGLSAETDIRFYFGRGLNCEQRDNVVRLTFERGAWKIDDIVDSKGMTIQQEIADRIRQP